MAAYKEDVLKESSRILDYILKDELEADEKDRIVSDSIQNFNEHVNPGWLEYRKSVSTDAAFVEWQDSQETFMVLLPGNLSSYITVLRAIPTI